MTATPGGLIAGRYELHDELAAGGMATVHFGRQRGAAGFARTVAIKRLHPHLARLEEFVAMFVDEATLASRIHHPNVVQTLDVVQHRGELLLVMEYVEGESLTGLSKAARRCGERMPAEMALRVVCDVLAGLHAAHEATSDGGVALEIVHRDVSPSNVLVGIDGVARVLDFGVAKATVRLSSTREGGMKGKLRYMAPEQIEDRQVTRRTDVYAASVMLWELLVGEPLFGGTNEGALIARVLEGAALPPSRREPALPAALDEAVLRGLARDPARRYATAFELAAALEAALPPTTAAATGAWVRRVAAESLAERRALRARIEGEARSQPRVPGGTAAAHAGAAGDPSATVSMAGPPALAVRGQVAPAGEGGTEVVDGPTLVAAATRPRDDRARTSLPLVIATVSLLCVVAVAAAAFLGTPAEERSTEAAREVSAAPAPSAPDSAALSADPPADDEPAAATGSAASASATISSSAAPVAPRPPPAPPPAAKPNCDQPFTVDANGRRRVRRECL